MDWFEKLKRDVAANITLPTNRFFKPTDEFFSVLQQFDGPRFIDCGCGLGQLTAEALPWGLHVVGVDLSPRIGQATTVIHMDALHMPFNEFMWPLICRPNHDGWCENVALKGLISGAKVLYVGLERNVEEDLGDLLYNVETVYTDVGEDGEAMFVLSGKPLDRWALAHLKYDGMHPCYD